LSHAFPKASRLLKKSDFQRVCQKGIKLFGNQIVMYAIPTQSPNSRIGISVPKRYGKSHDRNFFKRKMREYFRLQKKSLLPFDFHVMPLCLIEKISIESLEAEFYQLIDQIQLPLKK
jgi:ribonuclease P protein component